MDEQQLIAVNSRKLLRKILLGAILVAAYQFTFTDQATPIIALENSKLYDSQLMSTTKEDGSIMLTMQLSFNIELGKDISSLIKEAITAIRN